MAAADEGLFLNFAVDAAPLAQRNRVNTKSKRFKRQAWAEAKSKGAARPQRDGRPARSGLPRPAQDQNRSLKGYDLGSSEEPPPKHAAAEPSKDTVQAMDDSQPALEAVKAVQRAAKPAEQAGKARKAPFSQASLVDQIASQQQKQAGAVQTGANKPSQLPSAAAQDAESPPGADDEADIMAAVRLLRHKDAAVEADLPERPVEKEERERGVVVFSTDTRPTKRRKPNPDRLPSSGANAIPIPAKPAPRAAPQVPRRAGETAAANRSVPAATRADLFGAVDGSSFQGLGLAASLADHLEAINFTEPTRIQKAVIPSMLGGRDVLTSAPTGSGKTLAYIAPMVHQIQALEPRVTRQSGTHAVVMAPTRELCIQIYDVLSLVLRRYHWLIAGTVYGGENRDKEKSRLRKGINILVATPGRLLDHLQNTASFNVQPLHWLVLDEADRLLDLGFQQKIADILQLMDERSTMARQTALFSATLHSKLGSLATLSLHDPVAVGFSYTKQEGQLVVMDEGASGGGDDNDAPRQFELPKQLHQHFLEVPAKLRLVALIALLHSKAKAKRGATEGGKIVVFLSTCAGVDFHHALLSKPAAVATGARVPGRLFKLHGNLLQAERTATFLEFTKSTAGVLLCTDVAARGLDFSAVSSIIQYDPPGEPSEYVHRVGRTARMGHAGEAVLFLLSSEAGYLQMLNAHNVHLKHLPLDSVLQSLPDADAASGAVMDAIESDDELRQLAAVAFRAFVRAYAAHPASVKDIFHTKKLHLGHVADSFALRDSPSVFGRDMPAVKKKHKPGGKPGGRKVDGVKRKTQ